MPDLEIVGDAQPVEPEGNQKAPTYVVSANYRDRGFKQPEQKLEFPWLVREDAQEPEQAQPRKSIFATGVKFGRSGKEYGFGCSLVAYCETAVGTEEDNHITGGYERLTFDESPTALFDDSSFKDSHGHAVRKCKALLLCPDGSMYAVKYFWTIRKAFWTAAALTLALILFAIFG